MAEGACDSEDKYSEKIDQYAVSFVYIDGYLDSKPLVDGGD